VPVDGRGKLSGEVTLVTRGVVDAAQDAHLLASAREEAAAAVEELYGSVDARTRGMGSPADADIAEAAEQAVRRTLSRVLGFRPLTTAIVLRTRV
jgi:mRNA degradation ribonuclease J1/J2